MPVTFAAVFFGYTHRSFICLNHMIIIQSLMQVIIEDGKIPLGTKNCPVCHIRTVNVNSHPLKILLLAVQRNSIDVLDIYDSGFK